MHVELIN